MRTDPVRKFVLPRHAEFLERRVLGVRLADGSVEEAERVALCAGSIGSAAILLRLGIGPRRELEALGIKSVIDLPGVGGCRASASRTG